MKVLRRKISDKFWLGPTTVDEKHSHNPYSLKPLISLTTTEMLRGTNTNEI